MKFKGNFGELTLNINGTEATGTYQENGTLKGEFVNNTFKGQWENKGMEGLVEFTIIDNKLEGNWKKGIEPGPMKGKWEGKLLDEELSDKSKNFELFEALIVDQIFDTITSFKQLRNHLLGRLPLLKEIANNFDEFLEYYYNKNDVKIPFWGKTKLDYSHTICMNILNEADIDYDQHFEEYSYFTKEKASELLSNNNLYFPSFKNEDDFAKYDLDELINDASKKLNFFDNKEDYCRWHIAFIIYHYLTFGLEDLYEDNCEDEDSLEEFSIWVQKIVGTYWFQDHSISDKLDDPGNEILSHTIKLLEIMGDTSIVDEDSLVKEIYRAEDSEDFSAIEFIRNEFKF
jgi:hypothetical protein